MQVGRVGRGLGAPWLDGGSKGQTEVIAKDPKSPTQGLPASPGGRKKAGPHGCVLCGEIYRAPLRRRT